MSGEESLESDWSKFQRKLKNKKTEVSCKTILRICTIEVGTQEAVVCASVNPKL